MKRTTKEKAETAEAPTTTAPAALVVLFRDKTGMEQVVGLPGSSGIDAFPVGTVMVWAVRGPIVWASQATAVVLMHEAGIPSPGMEVECIMRPMVH